MQTDILRNLDWAIWATNYFAKQLLGNMNHLWCIDDSYFTKWQLLLCFVSIFVKMWPPSTIKNVNY